MGDGREWDNIKGSTETNGVPYYTQTDETIERLREVALTSRYLRLRNEQGGCTYYHGPCMVHVDIFNCLPTYLLTYLLPLSPTYTFYSQEKL